MIETFPAMDGCDSTSRHSGSQLRAMGGAELARLGEESLKAHLVDTAILAHQQYVPLAGPQLEAFLENRNLVRHPVRIAFEVGSMAPHQFAHPEPTDDGIVLYVHPMLKNRAEDLAFAVAYCVPLMNYGSLISDDHCLVYGATLMGITTEAYYQQLCQIADSIGAPDRERGICGDRF